MGLRWDPLPSIPVAVPYRKPKSNPTGTSRESPSGAVPSASSSSSSSRSVVSPIPANVYLSSAASASARRPERDSRRGGESRLKACLWSSFSSARSSPDGEVGEPPSLLDFRCLVSAVDCCDLSAALARLRLLRRSIDGDLDIRTSDSDSASAASDDGVLYLTGMECARDGVPGSSLVAPSPSARAAYRSECVIRELARACVGALLMLMPTPEAGCSDMISKRDKQLHGGSLGDRSGCLSHMVIPGLRGARTGPPGTYTRLLLELPAAFAAE
eukprot:scaffold340_cov256-Pinguiococcus_pyrenoidosus.AAC.15